MVSLNLSLSHFFFFLPQLHLSSEDMQMMLDGAAAASSGQKSLKSNGTDWETFVKVLGNSLWY